jgi:hypothetical protein
MMNARQRARSVEAGFLRLDFLFLVSLSEFRRHRFEVETVLGICWVFKIGVLKLL